MVVGFISGVSTHKPGNSWVHVPVGSFQPVQRGLRRAVVSACGHSRNEAVVTADLFLAVCSAVRTGVSFGSASFLPGSHSQREDQNMKIKISILKPRNRLVALALSRKAGAHRDRTKFAPVESSQEIRESTPTKCNPSVKPACCKGHRHLRGATWFEALEGAERGASSSVRC